MYRLCGSILPINIILHKKLNFVHHLQNLPLGTVACDTFEVIKRLKIGIYREVKEHLEKMNINNLEEISKPRFKAASKKYIFNKNKKDLIDMAQRYKKIDIQYSRISK